MGDPSQTAVEVELSNAGLFCLNCDYNLTGLSENICSECGQAFSPDELRARQSDHPTGSVPWDIDGGIVGFAQTWWMSIVSPRKLAGGFAAHHKRGRAAAYSLLCYLLAAGIFVAWGRTWSVAPSRRIEAIIMTAAIAAIGVLTVMLCEVVIACLLSLAVNPTRANDRYLFWRGITHYGSGFTILTALFAWLSDLGRSHPAGQYLRVLPAAPFIWWMATLCVMVARRSEPGPASWIGRTLIVIAGLLTLPVGLLIGIVAVIFYLSITCTHEPGWH
jgi:hypothetical protein